MEIRGQAGLDGINADKIQASLYGINGVKCETGLAGLNGDKGSDWVILN